MKEKVLYVESPEDTKCRRENVAEDEIEECTCQGKKKTTIAKVEIPKPKALVGGSPVYRFDHLPYWYCKIKNGRDTFMHLYMEDLTEKDLLYDSKTGSKREFSTNRQKKFKADVLEALANKPKEGYRWLPVFEPSSDGKNGLQFVIGEKPLVGLNCLEWNKKLKEYSPENGSGMSSKTTYFLLLLRWLKDDIATLEQLAEHSEGIGHYQDSENAKHFFEKTGERKFGGLYGFVGNTYKIVKDSNSETSYLLLGGAYLNVGKDCPFADIEHIDYPYKANILSVGLLELKK